MPDLILWKEPRNKLNGQPSVGAVKFVEVKSETDNLSE